MKKLITVLTVLFFVLTLTAGIALAKNDKAKGPSATAVEKANDNASFKRDDKTGRCTNLLGQEIACPDKDKKDKGEKGKDKGEKDKKK